LGSDPDISGEEKWVEAMLDLFGLPALGDGLSADNHAGVDTVTMACLCLAANYVPQLLRSLMNRLAQQLVKLKEVENRKYIGTITNSS
jgi:hypothetical protein